MKGHKSHHHGRKHRNTGGVNEAEMDLKTKPEARTNAKHIDAEAEERKHGGRAKKHAGKVHGEHAKHHAGRKPRKSGGRTGSDTHPFSSARHGTAPKGRKLEMEFE
jgi:hypothetical protein